MSSNGDIVKSLTVLTTEQRFVIEQLLIDEEHFGNLLIVLTSTKGVNFQFICDREIMSCNLGIGEKSTDEWLDLVDISKILKINVPPIPKDLLDFLQKMSCFISVNIELFNRLVNKKFYTDVAQKVYIYQKERFSSEGGVI